MSITTIEELEQVPIGASVNVLDADNISKEFTHIEGGWTNNEVTVGSDLLVGALAAGRVSTNTQVLVGSIWCRVGYVDRLRYVVGIDGEVITWVYVTPSGVAYQSGVESTLRFRHRAVEEVTAQMRDALRLATLVHTERIERLAVARQLDELRTVPARPPYPDGFVEALQRVAEHLDDSDLNEFLGERGLLPERTYTAEFRINGCTDARVSQEVARASLGTDGDAFQVDTEDARVDWSRTVTLERTGTGCICADIDGEDLEPFLPASWQEWDWELTNPCGGPGC